MKVDLNELSPWAEVTRVFSNMKALKVIKSGKTVGSSAELTLDDHGVATLAFGVATPPFGKKGKK